MPNNLLCNIVQDFYKFWPDEEAQYGKVKVTMKTKTERNSYNGYKFTVVGEGVVSEYLLFHLYLSSMDCY